ncbi:MAG: 1-acyl-sn-glycerol-3-phosphate acyltransferase [Oscillospiraceae bacterium]|nr:1-acyl-sn-glycerol-3-phosphate acyltransferase [Oscillospiraceae bacterium]
MNRLAMMVLKNITRVPGLWTKLCRYAKNPDNYPEEEMYAHIQKILTLAVKSGNIDLKVTGRENIPTEGGFVFYGNHQGLFDVLAIVATCDMPLGAVFKKELADIPFIKQIVSCTRSFAMDREDVRQSLTVIQAVTKELQNGRSYLIFPEGTRSKNGNQMGDFHGGSFRCAVKAKAPIVPIALIDCFKVLDQKGSKPVTVQIHYLKPIPYEEYKDLKTVDLAALVKARIAETIEANT